MAHNRHLLQTEFEVKLPCRHRRWWIAILIEKCEANLDDFQQINIAPQQLILVFCTALEITNRPCNYTRKLSVLSDRTLQKLCPLWQQILTTLVGDILGELSQKNLNNLSHIIVSIWYGTAPFWNKPIYTAFSYICTYWSHAAAWVSE